MSKRQYLENSILLFKESNEAIVQRRFSITRLINEGAISVCYEAYYEGGGKGILKEFYPNDRSSFVLERHPDGQLLLPKDVELLVRQRFDEEKQEYIKPYKALLSRKQSDDGELYAFLPGFEIYYGYDSSSNTNGTVYIWNPNPVSETFENICERIRNNPEDKPEYNLSKILLAIEALTRCVCILHKAGFVHRDIKPSNFGFFECGDKTLAQTILLFDIDSVSAVSDESKLGEVMGTPGYMEPEAKFQMANNQTDIYSIGATLYSAMVVEENNGFLKKNSCKRIKELLENSDLIIVSKSNSNPQLIDALVTILSKSLCKRNRRYENCEELLEDIKIALRYTVPN